MIRIYVGEGVHQGENKIDVDNVNENEENKEVWTVEDWEWWYAMEMWVFEKRGDGPLKRAFCGNGILGVIAGSATVGRWVKKKNESHTYSQPLASPARARSHPSCDCARPLLAL